MKFSKELKVALQAAEEAGKILNKYFNSSFKVEKKLTTLPVTAAQRTDGFVQEVLK